MKNITMFCICGLQKIYDSFNEKQLPEKKKVIVIGSGYACKSFQHHLDKTKYDLTIISPNVNPIKNNINFVRQPKYIDYLFGNDYKKIINIDININLINSQIINCKNINLKSKKIILDNDDEQSYDILVMAVGSIVNTFGIKGIEENCLFLKTENDIEKLLNEIKHTNPNDNIAILGGGVLGVEIASALKSKFTNVSIYEMANNLLPIKNLGSSQIPITNHLLSQGIIINCGVKVNSISKCDNSDDHNNNNNRNKLRLNFESATDEPKVFDKIIYTCGIKPNPIMKELFDFKCVNNKFNIINTHNTELENVYAIGDCNNLQPMSAQNAKNQGKHLAKLFNGETTNDYIFESKGTMIRLHNSAYLNSKYYNGYIPLFFHWIINNF